MADAGVSSRQLARHALRAKLRVAPDLLSARSQKQNPPSERIDEPLIDQGRKFGTPRTVNEQDETDRNV